MSESIPEITELLNEARKGKKQAENLLLDLIYEKLRTLAARYLRNERDCHTMQPSALVHEAYLKLFKDQRTDWANRAQFYGVAANTMRRILVDYARQYRASKRPDGQQRVDLADFLSQVRERSDEFIALDHALTELAERDPRQARIVELRFFGGLSVEEAAEVVGVSEKTVKRDWASAKAWLQSRMESV